MNLADELQKLETLRANGSITEAEFAQAKTRLLNETPPVPVPYAEPDASPSEPMKALQSFRRSTQDRWLGGICGALGARTAVPAWCWRVGFCLLFLSFGIGLIPYVLLWIFVPADNS